MGKLWYTDTNGKRKRTELGKEHEYSKFQSSENAKKDRAARNSARRSAIRSGIVHVGDNREIDHIRGLASGGGNTEDNTRVVSRKFNRSRKQNSRRRGSRRSKSSWGV